MKKLFIYHPLFRILSPIFIGVIVYLLILLINNNTDQIQEQFLGQELYVCIVLSYLIQELSIFLLWIFQKYKLAKSELSTLVLQVLASLVLCILVVTTAMILYFKFVLGFSPNSEELWVFNSIFSSICLIYISLYVSHQYLHSVNSKKLAYELLLKQNVEDEFLQFEKAINPTLLFESLDTLIILLHQNKDKTDDFLDCLGRVYRYILSTKNRELVTTDEEISNLHEFVKLFNYLPHRKLVLNARITTTSLTVPNSLLYIIEQIMRSSIRSEKAELELSLEEQKNTLTLKYVAVDRVNDELTVQKLSKLNNVYQIYSIERLTVHNEHSERIITIPKLEIAPTP